METRHALKQFRPTGPQKTTFHYFLTCSLLSKRQPEEVVEVSVDDCQVRNLDECKHCAKEVVRRQTPDVKRCPICERTLPLSEFHNNKNSRDGRAGYCRACSRMKLKAWAAENPGRLPELMRRHLFRKYGLTPETYAALVESQNGLCAVCKRSADKFHYGLAIDHDHYHNKVRGLLCGPCNTALGALQDSPEVVLALYEYIQFHQDRLWMEYDGDDKGEGMEDYAAG